MSEEKAQTRGGGLMSNPIYIQVIYPHLMWLRKQRSSVIDVPEKRGVNAGIILFSSIFLEGFLEDVLCGCVEHYANDTLDGKSKELERMEKLTSLRWYKKEFEDQGLSLDTSLSEEEREDLEAVFQFRNRIAHGQRDSYLIFHGDDFVAKGTSGSHYEWLEQFLCRRGVLNKPKSVQPNADFGTFSDPAADWIFDAVVRLVEKLLTRFEGESARRWSLDARLRTIRMLLDNRLATMKT